jgi:hypothetical protein
VIKKLVVIVILGVAIAFLCMGIGTPSIVTIVGQLVFAFLVVLLINKIASRPNRPAHPSSTEAP